MRLKSKLTLIIVFCFSTIYAQSDATWQKAVKIWEASKNIKAGHCIKSIAVGAKGYSSDYNKGGAVMEGATLFLDTGTFQIKVTRFTNNGEEIKVEGKPTKDAFWDMLHRKENLIFAKANQKHLTIIKKTEEKDADIIEYTVKSTIPEYPEFQATAYIKAETGNPVKIINAKYAKNKSASGSGKITITFSAENGILTIKEFLEEVKIEFFGNASYISESYVFSKYN